MITQTSQVKILELMDDKYALSFMLKATQGKYLPIYVNNPQWSTRTRRFEALTLATENKASRNLLIQLKKAKLTADRVSLSASLP